MIKFATMSKERNKGKKGTRKNFLSEPLTYTLKEVNDLRKRAYDAGLHKGMKEANHKSFQEGFDFSWNSIFQLNGGIKMDNIVQLQRCLEAIELFNKIAGNLDMPVNYQLEYSMLKSEVLEYYEANIKDNDIEKQDALGDIMVVLWGAILKHGLKSKFFSILTEICKSNLSKFPETAEEAQQTVQHYLSMGENVISTFDMHHNVYVIKDMEGKVMKSINWKPPQL